MGAKKLQDAQAAIGNTVTIFMIISVLLTVMLLIFINPIVAVMDTPEEAVKGITDYLIVCFIGIPFITAYNVISSIFRTGSSIVFIERRYHDKYEYVWNYRLL